MTDDNKINYEQYINKIKISCILSTNYETISQVRLSLLELKLRISMQGDVVFFFS